MQEVLRSRLRNNLPLVNTDFTVASSPATSSKRDTPEGDEGAGQEAERGAQMEAQVAAAATVAPSSSKAAEPKSEERDETAAQQLDSERPTPLNRPEDWFTGIMEEGGVHSLAGWNAAAESSAVERAAEVHFGAARADPAFVSGVLINSKPAKSGRRAGAGAKGTVAGGRRREGHERSLSAPTTFAEQKRAFITIGR